MAIRESDGKPSIIGVARYIMTSDQEAAEFAVVVTDAWQGHGVGWSLMQRLIAGARVCGLRRLEGAVLRNNHNMLKFTAALGFETRDNPEDHEQVTVTLELV